MNLKHDMLLRYTGMFIMSISEFFWSAWYSIQ